MGKQVYDQTYYTNYGHDASPYVGNLAIVHTLEVVAQHLYRQFHPDTHLDVGCAMGILVHAMRKLGVKSFGFDFSDYAIEHAHPYVKNFVWQQDILDIDPDDIETKYDLVTCIEVIEHIPAEYEDQVLDILCALSDIIFLSSEYNDKEPTHVNIQPLSYWKGKMLERGYIDSPSSPRTIPWGRSFIKATSTDELGTLLDRSNRLDVLRRDKYSCFICGKTGVQVHEILPRSAFGKKELHKCFDVKNRVCLCLEHHGPAHTKAMRADLLRLMSKRYGYVYSEPQYQKYLGEQNA